MSPTQIVGEVGMRHVIVAHVSVYGVYLIYDLAIGEQLGFTCILCQLFYERRSLATVVIGWYNRRQQDES